MIQAEFAALLWRGLLPAWVFSGSNLSWQEKLHHSHTCQAWGSLAKIILIDGGGGDVAGGERD